MQPGFQQPQEFAPMAPGDERLFVQFYLGSIHNPEKTAKEGRPIFDAVPFVKIIVPGDKNTIIDTIADNEHKRRFARMWSAFEQSLSQEMSGFPLRDWPAITRAQCEEMNHLNIYTVEQLATVADVYGAKIMGFQELRRKALTYIEQAKDTAYAQRVSSENQQLRNQVDALQGEVKRLSDMFDAMRATKPELTVPPAALKGQHADHRSGTGASRSS
jgi:hypothetical protein